jgi:hypothetical protein
VRLDAVLGPKSAPDIAKILLGAATLALLVSACGGNGPRTIEFSGYTWQVKSSDEGTGPGPNFFSDSEDNVWVDSHGRLHLKITYSDGRWYSAEVMNTRSLGLGRYSFRLGSPVSDFDPNVVLGLLTWSDDPAFSNREIEFEFSRWANAHNPTNAQYVVQPFRWNRKKVRQPPVASSTQSFDWRQNAVTFTSSSAVPSTWTTGHRIPPPGGEHVHMNLWLYLGVPTGDGRTAEVIVTSFEFTPTRHS